MHKYRRPGGVEVGMDVPADPSDNPPDPSGNPPDPSDDPPDPSDDPPDPSDDPPDPSDDPPDSESAINYIDKHVIVAIWALGICLTCMLEAQGHTLSGKSRVFMLQMLCNTSIAVVTKPVG